jgi:hypothetical protein
MIRSHKKPSFSITVPLASQGPDIAGKANKVRRTVRIFGERCFGNPVLGPGVESVASSITVHRVCDFLTRPGETLLQPSGLRQAGSPATLAVTCGKCEKNLRAWMMWRSVDELPVQYCECGCGFAVGFRQPWHPDGVSARRRAGK